MDFSLSDEQQLIVDTVRTFVENEIYPHEAEVERTGTVPRELGLEIATKCREIGFFAANIPEEFGGGGLNQLDFTLLEREIGRGSMALTVFFGRPSGILAACNERAARTLSYPCRQGRKVRCARHVRTGGRFRCARHEVHRQTGRIGLDRQRQQTFHQSCRHCRFRYRIHRHGRRIDPARAKKEDQLFSCRSRHSGIRNSSGIRLGLAPRLS